jgi:crotonobetainyl-CoA:carnitine CoA-transferase CaiB-like acyl-CoA transferase
MTIPSQQETPRPPVDTSADRLKVLDLGTIIAGPFAATLLGDLGAEVIKVERPDGGDTLRYARTGTPGMSNQWLVDARNKRPVTLNLRLAEGQDIVRRLAGWADVLVENFQPGTMHGWGLGYEDLRKVNPSLVYVSVSGYGQTGPRSAMPGFDQVATAYSGLTYMTGYPDRPPSAPGYAIADFVCGTFAALGALEAVRRRDRGTGEGEWVDCALFEPLLRISADVIPHYMAEGVVRGRQGGMPIGDVMPEDVTWGYVYESADHEWVGLSALPDFMFPRLTACIGRPDLDAMEELRTAIGRRRNVKLIDTAIRDWVAARSRVEALEQLQAHDVPCSPLNSVADLVQDEHVLARADIVTVERDGVPAVTMPGLVPKLRGKPGSIRWTGQPIGAANAEVYSGLLGMTEHEITSLREKGII